MESRKKDHIDLAFKSQVLADQNDKRFYYEPVLSGHPSLDPKPFQFLGKTLQVPFWVSSMTGGTEKAGHINKNLARACREFGMGMGLGSCRILLNDDSAFPDFNMRPFLGADLPLWANIGIAQLQMIHHKKEWFRLEKMIEKLKADGLIIHINPMQEWMQPEGDRLSESPLILITSLLENSGLPLIVKEVGQGMGPESLSELLNLPLQAIEFAAFGGTNFARLELLRNQPGEQEAYNPLSFVGHTADEMIQFVNRIVASKQEIKCNQLIISGGVKSFLDGYYLVQKSLLPAVFGQASGMLNHARGDYEDLKQYVEMQVKGYRLAETYLKVRKD